MKCFHRGMLCSYKSIGFSLILLVVSYKFIVVPIRNVNAKMYCMTYKKNLLKFTSPVSGEISVFKISIYHMYRTWNLPTTATNMEIKFLSKTCKVRSILSITDRFLLPGAQITCPSLFVSLFYVVGLCWWGEYVTYLAFARYALNPCLVHLTTLYTLGSKFDPLWIY